MKPRNFKFSAIVLCLWGGVLCFPLLLAAADFSGYGIGLPARGEPEYDYLQLEGILSGDGQTAYLFSYAEGDELSEFAGKYYFRYNETDGLSGYEESPAHWLDWTAISDDGQTLLIPDGSTSNQDSLVFIDFTGSGGELPVTYQPLPVGIFPNWRTSFKFMDGNNDVVFMGHHYGLYTFESGEYKELLSSWLGGALSYNADLYFLGDDADGAFYFYSSLQGDLLEGESAWQMFKYQNGELENWALDFGVDPYYYLDTRPMPMSPDARFVLFTTYESGTPGGEDDGMGLYLLDVPSNQLIKVNPYDLDRAGYHDEYTSVFYYPEHIMANSGVVFSTVVIYDHILEEHRLVAILPDGEVEELEDFIYDRMSEEEILNSVSVPKHALGEVEFVELLDMSNDGRRLMLAGIDADGNYDVFFVDLATAGVLSLSRLELMSDQQLKGFVDSGDAALDFLIQIKNSNDAQIAEFGRGLSSVLPAAVSNVMNNALNHTFNLNSRFDALHRESFTGLHGIRDDHGLGVYAYSTAVFRAYESNVSDVTGQTNSYGGMLVVDQKISDGFYVGAGFGAKTDESNFNTGAELDGETFSASLYATSRFLDRLHLDILFQFADVSVVSKRRSLDALTAKPEASAYGSEIRVSYYLEKDGFYLAPKLSLSYDHLDFDGYSESGGLSAAHVESFDVDSLRMTLGLQAQYQFTFIERPLIGSLQIDWNHEFIDESETVGAIAAGANFNAQTDDPDSDSGLISIGGSYLYSEQISLYAEYSKNFKNSLNDDHIIRVGLGCSF